MELPLVNVSTCKLRSRSGRPVTATDNAAVAAVRNVVEADRRVTINEIMIRLPPGIEIGRSSIVTIMSDVLNFRKVCARWVPRFLSDNHKQQRMEAARAFLEMHRRDGYQRFSRIVPGDESWVYHSTSETKRQSVVWKKPEESAPKKAKVTISAAKVMAIVFWDCKGVLLVDYLPPNTTVNAANDDEVQAEANHWLRRQDTVWYNSDIKKLLQRYQKCLDRNVLTVEAFHVTKIKEGHHFHSNVKVMLTAFFDSRGVVHYDYSLTTGSITKEHYRDVLRRLCIPVQRKRPEL
ncbi:hypothetical protein LAZ67_15001060 [Cordylochernes scorpioides]|uniref:Transposase n=1 Tax=Cordylochernes scorpioides TaxID=51811 RepID=A0ABY6L8J1_9ARAC|nr:hypothetical protein LAZ67_15001060 [Cordylochernes scorpioides]